MKSILMTLSASTFFYISIANAFEPTITIAIENPERPTVLGISNLPDKTKLLISIRRSESNFFAQSNATILSGHFKSDRFSQGGAPLNPGTYKIEVVMPLPTVQPEEVRRIIGSSGEKLSGPLVHRDKFGLTLVSTTTFKVGAGANARLDAEAREKSAKDLDRWIVDNCKSIVDHTNSMVRSGAIVGKELIGQEKEQRISTCIAELRANKLR